jgi:hypothetical protein
MGYVWRVGPRAWQLWQLKAGCSREYLIWTVLISAVPAGHCTYGDRRRAGFLRQALAFALQKLIENRLTRP